MDNDTTIRVQINNAITHRVAISILNKQNSNHHHPILNKTQFIQTHIKPSSTYIFELDFKSFEPTILLFTLYINGLIPQLSSNTQTKVWEITNEIYLNNSVYETINKFALNKYSLETVKQYFLSTMYGATTSYKNNMTKDFQFLNEVLDVVIDHCIDNIKQFNNRFYLINDFQIPIDITQIITSNSFQPLNHLFNVTVVDKNTKLHQKQLTKARHKILNYFIQSNAAYCIQKFTDEIKQLFFADELLVHYNCYDSLILSCDCLEFKNLLIENKQFFYDEKNILKFSFRTIDF